MHEIEADAVGGSGVAAAFDLLPFGGGKGGEKSIAVDSQAYFGEAQIGGQRQGLGVNLRAAHDDDFGHVGQHGQRGI